MDYLKEKVLPAFKSTVEQMREPLKMEDAKRTGQCFIANHIDANQVENRGEVYEFFEDLETYVDMKKALYADRMNGTEIIQLDNMKTLAKGISWAVQHDGFDFVKYDGFPGWGHDIESMKGKVM